MQEPQFTSETTSRKENPRGNADRELRKQVRGQTWLLFNRKLNPQRPTEGSFCQLAISLATWTLSGACPTHRVAFNPLFARRTLAQPWTADVVG